MEIILPSHPESERALVGICLAAGAEAVESITEAANPNGLFFDERNGELFARIERLALHNRPVNLELVAKEKANADVALEYIAEIERDALPLSFLGTYLKTAVEYQKRRRVVKAAWQLCQEAQDASQNLDASIEAAESVLYSPATVVNAAKSIKAGIKRVLSAWEYANEHRGQLTGIAGGLDDLDRMTWGFQPEHLIIIGARPSQGKTALLCTIATNAAIIGKVPTLFFSLESSTDEIIRRLMCGVERMDGSKFRAGNITEGDMVKMSTASGKVNRAPLVIEDRGSLTIGQLRSIARRTVKREGIKLILVDYLQKVRPGSKSEKRTYEVGQVSEGLKEMAKELRVPVIAACQLNRESEKDKGRAPRPSDLGDSGMIERDADMIAMLYRKPDQVPNEPQEFRLIIGKHRDGEIGSVRLVFMPKWTRFESATAAQQNPA